MSRIERNALCFCGSGRKYKRCCGSSVAGPGAAGFASISPRLESVPALLQMAMAHHRDGRLEDAAALYRKILTIAPRNFDALHLLGVIAHQSGQHVNAVALILRALACFDQIESHGPSNPFVHNNLGEAYRALGMGREAINCYRAALEIKADYAEAHYHLGLVLAEEGRNGESIACFREAIALKPELTLAHYNLGTQLKADGNLDAAVGCFRQVLLLDPQNELAQFSLSSVLAQNPERAPEKYIVNLFDNHAHNFDVHLTDTLHYRVPKDLVAFARKKTRSPEAKWDVLDLGCGTGLAGLAVAPFALSLVGVDLSKKMLDKARERKLYSRLEQQDLVPMMKAQSAESYDLVVAADVFVYVGELSDVFFQARRLLRSGGLLAFSVEASESLTHDTATNDYLLQTSGRFAHSQDYLYRLGSINKFSDVDISPTEIRLEKGVPVRGWLAVLAV